jgi:hypothetical protein
MSIHVKRRPQETTVEERIPAERFATMATQTSPAIPTRVFSVFLDVAKSGSRQRFARSPPIPSE